MNRLEEIKERQTLKEHIKTLYNAPTKAMFTQTAQYTLDIEYLINRLERYENALLKYSVMIVLDSEDHPHDVGMVAREAIEESLKEE